MYISCLIPPVGAGERGRNPLAGVRLLPPAGYAVVGALLKCPLPLDFAAFVACGLTVVCHSTFPGPDIDLFCCLSLAYFLLKYFFAC